MSDRSQSETALPQFISLASAARRMGVKERTLRRWAADGTNGCPEPYRFGTRKWSFLESEISEWIEGRKGRSDEGGEE